MKNVAFPILILTFLLFSACEKTAFMPSDSTAAKPELREEVPCASADFLTSEDQKVGLLTIEEVDGYLKFTFRGDEGWFFRRIHLYTGLLEDVPLSEGGIPKVGQFEYSQTYFPYPAYDIFFIARERIQTEDDSCFVVACQAEIYYIVDGTVVDAQYVWAEGTSFTEASPASYFTYCLGCKEIPPVIPPDDDPDDNLSPIPDEAYQNVSPSQKPGAYPTLDDELQTDNVSRIPVNSHRSKAPDLKPGAYQPGNENPGQPGNQARLPGNARQKVPTVMKPGAYISPIQSGNRAMIPLKALESRAPVLKPGEMEN